MDQPAGSAASIPRAAGLGVTPAPPASVPPSDRVPVLAWLIAAVFVAVELAVSGRYGFMQDELYFIEAGRHLAFGYVDQPPLTPLLTRVSEIAGLSPTAIRVIPALAGGAVVVAAARFAALFGAGRLGRVLAALTMACTPVLLGADHVDNTTSLDLLAWTAVLLCVTTALLRHRPRWWLGAGAAAGIGLETNNLILMLLLGLGLGVLLSQHAAHEMAVAGRRHCRGDLGSQPDLAGHARVATAGHGFGVASAEHHPGRLPGRGASPAGVRGAGGRGAGHRGLHQAMADT